MDIQKEDILIKIKLILLKYIDFLMFLLLAIIFVPSILFIIHFFLPEELKEKLVLHRDYVIGYEIFTEHFIHLNLEHLRVNVVEYLIVIISLYALLYSLNEKRLFWVLFVLNLSVLPILFSLVLILVNKYSKFFESTRGFSGIVLCFLGMTVHSFFHFFYKKFGINLLNYRFLILILVIFFYFLSIISLRVVLPDFVSSLLIIILLIISFLIFFILPLRHTSRELKRKFLLYLLYALWFFLLFFFTFLAFPFPPESVNILMHYIGFVVGFLTILILMREDNKKCFTFSEKIKNFLVLGMV